MLSRNSFTIDNLRRLPWRAITRWWITGLSLLFVGLATLYVLTDVLRIPLLLGTILAAEATTIVRYGINDRWVFGQCRPSWTRFWRFHVANAGGFVIWWAVANTLPRFGVQYLLASTAGTACAVLVNMATNFLWVWRRHSSATFPPAIGRNSPECRGG